MAAYYYKWLMTAILGLFHPFYVSVTEINHNAKDRTLELACKLFLEDIEKTLQKQLNTPVELTQPKNMKKAQQMVSDYIRKHLVLTIDGRPVNLEFQGYEVEGASLWSYFQVSNISTVHQVDISNNLLYEAYSGQIGIVHVQVGSNKKSLRVVNPETRMHFVF